MAGPLDHLEYVGTGPSEWLEQVETFKSLLKAKDIERLEDFSKQIFVYAKGKVPDAENMQPNQCHIFVNNLAPALQTLKELPVRAGHIATIIIDTKHARQIKLAELLTTFLAIHFNFRNVPRQGLQLTLSEAITNAVEHGNLELSELKAKVVSSHDYLTDFFSVVEERLADPKWGERLIVLRFFQDGGRLVVELEDEGNGFDVPSIEAKINQDEATRSFGRGFSLMHQMMDEMSFCEHHRKLILKVELTDSPTINADLITPKDIRIGGKILLVDDQMVNRQLARHFLLRAGYQNIEEASSGNEAIEKALTVLPDLILLDIVMPDVDGFEVCRILKTDPRTSHIPIIFVSTLADLTNRTRGYELGAVDYINKPVERSEMLARTEVHIKNGMLMKRLQEYSDRVRQELDEAQKFQLDLLPKQEVVDRVAQRFDVKINTLFQASQELAGDYWSIYPIDDNRFGVLMADFTGHGVVSALNTVRLHSAMIEVEKSLDEPDVMLRHLNDILYNTLKVGHFATCVAGVYEASSRRFTYCSAGAPDILHVKCDCKNSELLDCTGLPLGLVPSDQRDFSLASTTLEKGESLIFYSDALIETPSKLEQKVWGEEGVLSAVEGCSGEDDCSPFDNIKDAFFKMVNMPLKDDLTLLSFQLKK